jgi:hypothetical protein
VQKRDSEKQVQSSGEAESQHSMRRLNIEKNASSEFTPQSRRQGAMAKLRQMMGAILPKRPASAPPVLQQDIELDEIVIPPQVKQRDKSPKQVRFQEAIEQVCLNDQAVRISREAFSDMRMAQQDLDRQMPALQKRVKTFPKGDVQDLVRDALRSYHAQTAQDDRYLGLDMVSLLLRGNVPEEEENTAQALNRRLFRVGVSLQGVERTLKLAQEEMEYQSMPNDDGLTAIRTTVGRYLGAIDRLVVPQPAETVQADNPTPQENQAVAAD